MYQYLGDQSQLGGMPQMNQMAGAQNGGTPGMPQQQPVMQQANFARGGNVHGMRKQAQHLGAFGQRGDNILAHINPQEAEELAMTHGMDINPMTGLPQYGLWDSMQNVSDSARMYAGQGMNAFRGYAYPKISNYANQGLGYLDQGIQSGLNALGTGVGGYFGHPNLGGQAGSSLGSAYKQTGGMQGYLMPRINNYLGLGQAQPVPQMPGARQMAGYIGSNLYNSAGRQMVGSGLKQVDQGVQNFLPRLGSHIGQQMGGGQMGQQFGAGLGRMAGNAYQGYGGLAGQQGRMENMVGLPPPLPEFAKGGPVDGDFFFRPPVLSAFATGGKALPEMAEELRKKGQRNDKILAHISPEEAAELEESYGGDINPDTGLPQFGRKWFQKGLFKTLLPVLGSVVGSMFGGPAGAIVGGGLGKAASSRKNVAKSFLKGAGVGAGIHFGAGALGAPLGIGGPGGGLSAFGLGNKAAGELGRTGLMSQLSNLGSETAAPQVAAATSATSATSAAPSLWGDLKESSLGKGLGYIFGGASDLAGGPLNLGLLGATGYGLMKGKQKQPKQSSLQELMNEAGMPQARALGITESIKPSKQAYRQPPPGYQPGIDPLWQYYEDVDPVTGEPLHPRQMAEGGYANGGTGYADGGTVAGYLPGPSGGQEDNVDVMIQPGDFVWNATDTSLIGDGNSEAGARKIYDFENEIDNMFKGIQEKPKPVKKKAGGKAKAKPKAMPAKLSQGEYVTKRETLVKLGKGDADEGARKIEQVRKNLRKHKGVKKILPPKTKPIKSYLEKGV